MTEDGFRTVVLFFPGVSEGAHMGHPDFRVNGRIFATLGGSGKGRGMVKVPPEQQHNLIQAHPEMFEPVNGAWGRQGCTSVILARARKAPLREAVDIAWRWASSLPAAKQRAKKHP